MEKKNFQTILYLYAALFFICLLAFWLRTYPGPQTIDDAYITLRMVNNIIQGKGFVYNPGERLCSTSTPAYALILAPLAYFASDTIWVGLYFNAFCSALMCVCLFWIGKRLTRSPALGIATGLVFAVDPSSVIYSLTGMETPFYSLLMLLSIIAFVSENYYVAAALCGILPIARPDGIILAGIIGTGIIMIKGKKSLRPALLALAVAGPWYVYATLYFGSPIPHSLLRKALAFGSPIIQFLLGRARFEETLISDTIAHGIRQWVYHYYSLFYGKPIHVWNVLLTPYPQLLSKGAPFIICFLSGSIKICKNQRMFIPLVIFPVIYALLFILQGAGIPYHWYFIPTNGFFIAVTFGGMFFLVKEITSRFFYNFFKKYSSQVSAAAVISVCLIIALIRLFYYYDPSNKMLPTAIYEHLWLFKEPVYKEVAEFLNQRDDNPSTLILSGEVGAFGYYSKYKVWDDFLTKPFSVKVGGTMLIYKYKPKFITFMGFYAPAKELIDQPTEWILNSKGDKYVKIFQMNKGNKEKKRQNVVAYEFIPGSK